MAAAFVVQHRALQHHKTHQTHEGEQHDGLKDRIKHARVDDSGEDAVESPRKRQISGNLDIDGVEIGIYTSWLREELDKEEACLELPMTLAILFAFSFMALMHLQQNRVTIIEKAIREDIVENANFAWAHNFGHKGIDDVNSFADFWSWTRLGLLPLLTGSWAYSEELGAAVQNLGYDGYDVGALPSQWLLPGQTKPVPIRNDYLRYNRLIGGIRFGQDASENADIHKCLFPTDASAFESWFQKPCTPVDMAHVPPDQEQAAEIENAKRVEWIITEISTSDVLRKIVDMEDGCASAVAANRTCLCEWCSHQSPMQPWLNEMTRRVQISFVIFNPTFGLYSQAGINFWFNRAGHIYKLIKIRSAWCNVFARPPLDVFILIVADAVWLAMLVKVTVNEVREIVDIIKKKRKPWYVSFIEDYLAFWNVVDWISIVCASTIVYYLVALFASTGVANSALGSLAQTLSSNTTLRMDSLSTIIESFYTDVTGMLAAEDAFRFQLVIYPMIIMLRLFKSFDAQPRLAIVTQTFVEASSDLFHFAIVFFSVYVCMVVNAVLFFGQDSEAFATFERAWHSAFMVLYGAWDYDEMEQIGRLKASVWFWMFQIIVVLILQNITLAILMDAYTVAKGDPDAESQPISLSSQISKQWRRFRQARRHERVRLNDIYDALKKDVISNGLTEDWMLESQSLIFPKQLLEKVQNIPKDQAHRTLKDAQKDYDSKNVDPPGPDILQPDLFIMKSRTRYAAQTAHYLNAKVQGYTAWVQPLDEKSGDQPENLGSVRESHERDRLQDAMRHAAQCLQNEIDAVRNHTQDNMETLSVDMVDVLAEEMESLERRQKEHTKMMEQAYASLKGAQTLAYKLSDTCIEIESLVAAAIEESLHSAETSVDVSGSLVSGESVPEPPAPAGVVWPNSTTFAVECLDF